MRAIKKMTLISWLAVFVFCFFTSNARAVQDVLCNSSYLFNLEADLELAKDINDIESILYCSFRIGEIRSGTSDVEGSITILEEALPVALENKEPYYAGNFLILLGDNYFNLGYYEIALAYYYQAEEVATWGKQSEIGEAAIERIDNLLNPFGLGSTEKTDQQLTEEFLELAEELRSEGMVGDIFFGDITLAMIDICQMADIKWQLEEYEDAYSLYQDCYEYAKSDGNDIYEAVGLTGIGVSAFGLKNYSEALNTFNKAYEIWGVLNAQLQQSGTLVSIGDIYYENGDINKAVEYYERSIAIREKYTNNLSVEQLIYNIQSTSVYDRLVGAYWQLGDYQRSFEYAEKAKVWTELRQDVDSQVVFQSDEEKVLANKIIDLQAEIDNMELNPDDYSSTELTDKYSELRRLVVKYRTISPYSAQFAVSDFYDIEDIQAAISDQVTVLSYYLTDNKTYIFIISKHGFDGVAINVSRETLDEKISLLRFYNENTLFILYEMLFKYVESHIYTEFVGIVPHESIYYVPFAALNDGSQYLGEEYAFFMLPSISVLFTDMGIKDIPGEFTSPLIVGNPNGNLSSSEEEVKTIARILGSSSNVEAAATEEIIKNLASEADLIHIAAHGHSDAYKSSLFYSIDLLPSDSNDGKLQSYEIYDLGLKKTKLVVLSACNTLTGYSDEGDDFRGLTKSFMVAGAPTVVASLWQVSDVTTSIFMEQFYSGIKKGFGPSQALQVAQYYMREKTEYTNYKYWGGFVLAGNPGEIYVNNNLSIEPFDKRFISEINQISGDDLQVLPSTAESNQDISKNNITDYNLTNLAEYTTFFADGYTASPDGRWLLVWGYGSTHILLYDNSTGHLYDVKSFGNDAINSAAYSPDANLVAFSYGSPQSALAYINHDGLSDWVEFSYDSYYQSNQIKKIAWNPDMSDGMFLAGSTDDGSVFVEMNENQIVHYEGSMNGLELTDLKWSFSGKYLYMRDYLYDHRLWEFSDNKLSYLIREDFYGKYPYATAFSWASTKNHAAIGIGDQTVIIDMDNLSDQYILANKDYDEFAWSVDDKHIAGLDNDAGLIEIWNVEEKKIAITLPLVTTFFDISWVGNKLFLMNYGGEIIIFELNNGSENASRTYEMPAPLNLPPLP